MAEQVRKELNDKWPADFDAAYDFFVAQLGVDKSRIGFGGGSCGVTNAMKLAESHPDVKALVLLAGTTDVKGMKLIADHPERPILTAAAADDEFNDDAVQVMRWTADFSGNPRAGFPASRTGVMGPRSSVHIPS